MNYLLVIQLFYMCPDGKIVLKEHKHEYNHLVYEMMVNDLEDYKQQIGDEHFAQDFGTQKNCILDSVKAGHRRKQ